LTETQYITFILGFAATIAAILIALLINNARLTDVKEVLRAEIDSKTAGVLTQMATYQMDIISKIAELDNRITRLER
jgi:hypothetical protein